jgi:hypothetical protein
MGSMQCNVELTVVVVYLSNYIPAIATENLLVWCDCGYIILKIYVYIMQQDAPHKDKKEVVVYVPFS